MNSNTQVVNIDLLRTLAFGSVSGSYTKVGGPFAHPVRLICITNNLDGDATFSVDGVNDYLFLPKGTFKLFDLNTNRRNQDQYFVLPVGTQIFVKSAAMLGSGGVFVECLWGE